MGRRRRRSRLGDRATPNLGPPQRPSTPVGGHDRAWGSRRSLAGGFLLYRPACRGHVARMRMPPAPTALLPDDAPLVFLVHGFLRTGASMLPMAAGLRARGYRSSVVTQINLHREIPDLADSLFERVEGVRGRHEARTGLRPAAHFVTHSMGGIVVRSMLSRREVDGPNRCVLLAPPNKGSRLADHMRDRLGFPWGAFDPLAKLLPGERGQCQNSGDPDAVVGIVVGTAATGFTPPWRTLGGGFRLAADGEHDGTVAVDEAHLDSAADFARVPYAHSLMMLRRPVIDLTARFLRDGRFE